MRETDGGSLHDARTYVQSAVMDSLEPRKLSVNNVFIASPVSMMSVNLLKGFLPRTGSCAHLSDLPSRPHSHLAHVVCTVGIMHDKSSARSSWCRMAVKKQHAIDSECVRNCSSTTCDFVLQTSFMRLWLLHWLRLLPAGMRMV